MRKTLWEPSGWPALLLVAVLTVCAYLPARRGGFIWDDVMNVSNNPVMTEAGGLRRIWVPGGTPQYYPATYTAFWAERRLLGLDTRGYHAVNVALHVANLILVWLVLKRLKVRGALLAAAVFALHPVQVETVAWITELKNLLSTLFYLLALLQFLRFEERGSRGCYAGSLALYLLALLNKTAVCTFPLVLLILRWRDRGKLVRRDLLETAPFLALSAALGLVTIHVEGAGGEFALSPVERLLLACRAPWFYASKLAWPAGLSFNYDRWRFDSCAPGQWAWVALSGAAALACWRWRRRLGKDALAALAFFVLTLAPVLGFFDVFYYRYSYVADHFQYLASLGLICLAAGACTKLIERGGASRRRAAFACAGAAVALLWTATWRRAHAFQDVETLYRDTIAKTPAAYMAQSNLANILAARGEHREALRHYAAALAADPRIAEVHTNIGHSLEKLGRRDEEIRHYREAIKLKPGYVNARNDLGVVLSAQGRTLEAAGQFEAALAADPRSIEAHVNLGHCLERLGRRDEEIRHYREALRIDPGYVIAHNDLAVILAAQGRYAEAIEHYREAVRLAPGYAPAYRNWAGLMASLGRRDAAAKLFEAVVKLDPTDAQARAAVKALSQGKEKR